jgi:RNA polymerase sigma factor (sigma-70 family)
VTELPVEEAIARAHHEEWARVVAGLARRFGDLDLAEDAAAEAYLTAVERWPRDGVPPNPGGWLTRTAGNRAIDRIRRESHRDAKHQAALMISDDTPPEPTGVVEDDRLRLIFTCCHPALAPEAQVALTLRLLGGLTVAEIAQAFLVPETTMAQRITRAKKKISVARIPTSSVCLAPTISRESRSRPWVSPPSGKPGWLGAMAFRARDVWPINSCAPGSWGAIHGAMMARNTNNPTITAPTQNNGELFSRVQASWSREVPSSPELTRASIRCLRARAYVDAISPPGSADR